MDIERAAKLAVENIVKEGLTDIFPPPQELLLLENEAFRRKLIGEVTKCVKGNSLDSLDIGSIDHVLLPKGGPFAFRRCALIQPLDTIKYLTLVLTMADGIEKSRPASRKKIAFSYRFGPEKKYLFNPRYNITAFRKYTNEKSLDKKCKFLVSCDIANFYDRLNLHRLESILLSLGIEERRVRQLNDLLLFWADRNSHGLPVGSNASRILAEAALLEVDKYMLSIGAKFCRFVDDYRLFASDKHQAHYWLTQLIERLWLEDLTINNAKTKIEDVSERGIEHSPKEADEATKKIHHQARIIAGYGGEIPTRFRKPSLEEVKKFKATDPAQRVKDLKTKNLPTPEDMKDCVKSIAIAKRCWTSLSELADFFPQFTPYIVDSLCKSANDIATNDKRKIRDQFAQKLTNDTGLPEYIKVKITELLGTEDFASKETLFGHFRALSRNAGSYIGRATLDALEDHVSRGEVLEIRQYFSRADSWEKRQIVRIVDKHLHEGEKRPWLKNVKIQEARDIFLVEQITSTPPQKKRKR